MALCKEQLDKLDVRKLFPKERSGTRKWFKNQINRLIRRQKISEDSPNVIKKLYKGYEY